MSEGDNELRVAMALFKTDMGLGRARMDTASRERLGLTIGDVIEIKGKKSVAARLFKDAPSDGSAGIICLDGVSRKYAGVSLGDNVKVFRRDEVPADRITIAPMVPEGKTTSFDKNISDRVRQGLFNRPVLSGNEVVVPNVFLSGSLALFKVIECVPDTVCVITPSTEVEVLSEPPHTEKKVTVDGSITYDDVGGLNDQIKKIREMIELPLKHPELFTRLGIKAPKGVLLYGPPGTGKTLIAKAVSTECGASFYSIQGPEILNKFYGETESALRGIFEKAAKHSPSIVFIDELDSIAPDRESAYNEVDKRLVAQLLTLMDGLSSRGDVVVIGATNRENSIDPALRRPGRFDREIEIGVPGMKARAEILSVHLRSMPLDDDVSIEHLASVTQGFVGADLAALAREAAMKCLSKHMSVLDSDSPATENFLSNLKVSRKDFDDALNEIEPSGMREVIVDIPKVRWSDLGGLDSVRRELSEVFIPDENGKGYERLGIDVPKGVLLYGPPGTGKTLIAKALANESGANFINVNGPEIASKWLGESEKAIKQIFKRAKQMAPCIIFFDEMDSIAPSRYGGSEGTWDRVVNQILTSLDGMETMKNVLVVGATNRPDMIDPALLRPGRLDKKLLIGLPDCEGRKQILGIHSARMPLKDVDIDKLAHSTEGYTGADLAELCREAGLTAYREDPDTECVTEAHFAAALRTVKPSVSSDEVRTYAEIEKRFSRRRPVTETPPLYR